MKSQLKELDIPHKEKAVQYEKLSVEQLQKVLPKHKAKLLNQSIVDRLNSVIDSTDIAHEFRDNFVSYTSVLKEGKYRIDEYMNAVQYCTYKLMGQTNIEAFVRTFPERYDRFLELEMVEKDIHSRVSVYAKGQLVNAIMEQSLIPIHVLNADVHQQAINHLAYLMLNAKSEKVQSDSAAKLVDALKMPETQKIELDIGLKEDDAIKDLRESTMELVKQQKLMMGAGALNAKQIAESKLVNRVIDIEIEEVNT